MLRSIICCFLFYYIKAYWDKINDLGRLPTCTYGVMKELNCIFQDERNFWFLMDLSNSTVWSQILTMKLLPIVSFFFFWFCKQKNISHYKSNWCTLLKVLPWLLCVLISIVLIILVTNRVMAVDVLRKSWSCA